MAGEFDRKARHRKVRHRVDTFTLKACIDSLQRELAKVEVLAAGHRADFERECDRMERLTAEPLNATADTLAALRSRPWWRLGG